MKRRVPFTPYWASKPMRVLCMRLIGPKLVPVASSARGGKLWFGGPPHPWPPSRGERGEWTWSAAALCLLLLAAPLRAEPIEADLVLRGGTLYDGSGAEPATGDLAVKGDRITTIGSFETAKVGLEIDCRGLVVAPGFIDLHNHSDAQVIDRLTRANVNFLMQGCTTIVTGNCGSGPVEVADYYHKIDAAGA